MFFKNGNKLEWRYWGEQIVIEPWGDHGLRVRATKNGKFSGENWALEETPVTQTQVSIDLVDRESTITNGNITAKMFWGGRITFYNQKGEELLKEYSRAWYSENPESYAIRIPCREYRALSSNDFQITAHFEGDENQKIFGMGQYQMPHLDLNGCTLELAQRNSQASVPFALSTKGYGFLWNNPAVGKVTFGKNIIEWTANSAKELDYWITAGDTPKDIMENYTAVVGRAPLLPENVMGFWQCRLRYRTQEEVLEVAREYKRRGVPLDVIVIDFFHWELQGDWSFDKKYFPDPKAMVDELKEMGVRLMVSIWPTVDSRSKNFHPMNELGYLIRSDQGTNIHSNFFGDNAYYDATNPEARKFVWEKAKENYHDYGIDMFWLDEAEPEYETYTFQNFRYYKGTAEQVGNEYPKDYAKTFYEGEVEAGQENIINLIRCAWVGSQKYAVCAWSGDIPSTFEAFRNQVAAGLNMGVAGIPWWTTDIGGFAHGDANDPAFRELLVRWFQYGTFCPIMRLHGDRQPEFEADTPGVTSGGGACWSGAPNEIWSYGEENFKIFEHYINIRVGMKEYIKALSKEAHEKGLPMIRSMYFEFPDDPNCAALSDQFMFGSDYVVAPVLHLGQRERDVYLPVGNWKNIHTGEVVAGGQTVKVDAPLEIIPVFIKEK